MCWFSLIQSQMCHHRHSCDCHFRMVDHLFLIFYRVLSRNNLKKMRVFQCVSPSFISVFLFLKLALFSFKKKESSSPHTLIVWFTIHWKWLIERSMLQIKGHLRTMWALFFLRILDVFPSNFFVCKFNRKFTADLPFAMSQLEAASNYGTFFCWKQKRNEKKRPLLLSAWWKKNLCKFRLRFRRFA